MKNVFLLFAAFTTTALWGQVSGKIDSTFADNGVYQANVCVWDVITDVAMQEDGKIVVAGFSEEDGHSEFMVTRVLPDGNPDIDFGVDGLALAKVSEWINEANALAIQPDGKILIGGYTNPTDDINEDCALLRFTSAGKLDSSFNQDGIALMGISHRDRISAIALQPDGKILAAGFTVTNKRNFILMRFLPNGTLDASFGTNNGFTVTSMGTVFDLVSSLAIQPDGKILLTGYTVKPNGWPDVALARYDTSGILDPTFGTGGKVTTAFGTTAEVGLKVVTQPDGKILVSGYSNNLQEKSELALFRYLPDGTLDTDFNGTGKLRSKIGDSFSSAETVFIRPDGKILTAGCSRNTSSGFDFAMKQFNANGTVDNTFGTNGIITTDLNGLADGVSDILFLDGGKIILAGTGYSASSDKKTDIVLVRYLSDLSVGIIETPQSILAPWVYPNPVSNAFTVKYKLNTSTEVAFDLLTIDGKLLANLHKSEQGAGEQMQELSLPTELSSGSYLLNIRTAQGNAVVQLLCNR